MTDQPALPPPGPVRRPASNDGLASVVLIDRRDDVAAVCGRVDTAPTLAVVIHAPDGNRQLATQLGMRRLVRHAEDSGRVIAIATKKRGLATRARATGVPVGRRPDRIRWDAGGRRVFWIGPKGFALPGLGRYLQFAVLAAAMAAAGAATLTLLPSAEIVASPPVRESEVTLLLTLSEELLESDIDAREVPLREVTTTRTVTLAAPATGLLPVPVGRAAVLVTLSNTSDEEITVPYGAVLRASPSGLVFLIDQETDVPAGKAVVQQASAIEPGPGGNVPAGSLTTWESEGFDDITVTNAEAAAGGTIEDRQAVSEADLAALEAVAQSLVASARWRSAIIEDRPEYGIVARTVSAEVGTTRPFPAVGEAANVLLLEVEIEITALAILPESLALFAAALLDPRDGGELLPGTVRAVETGRAQGVDEDDEDIYISEFRLVGGFATLSEGEIKAAVKGKSPGDARSTLQERYGIRDAAVDLSPGFLPWLPRFDFRIDVSFEAPPDAEETVETSPTPDAESSATVTPTPTQTPGP